MRLALLVLLLSLSALQARAHSLTTSVLSIRQISAARFTLHWDHVEGVRERAAVQLVLAPEFPAHCRLEHDTLTCGAQGLSGRLGFAGLDRASTSVLLKLHWLDRPMQLVSLSAARPSVQLQGAPANLLQRALGFTWLGLEHIWFGWDHLLFVLGLTWLVRSRRTLLQTITAFTLAHSLTLAAATLQLGSLPSAPVEASIALSIVFVAVEVVKRRRDGEQGLTARAPWLVAFAFGLLHGFGFAGALAELSIAQSDVPLALTFFNVGVELGQLLFVGVLSLSHMLLQRRAAPLLQRAAPYAEYAMGSIAMYWLVERVCAF